jgi:predicted ArsR family transcriptional regulator
MNVRVFAASIWLPPPLRKKNMAELFRLTARAFGGKPLSAGGPAGDRSLESYAIFTRSLVEAAMADGRDMAALRTELRREAFSFGESLRRQFRLRSRSEALRALKLAYKSMGIVLTADAQGWITVRRCFFSRIYAPETCRVVAALDEGLMAGMLGEGNLEFKERITEGHAHCRAEFRMREEDRS